MKRASGFARGALQIAAIAAVVCTTRASFADQYIVPSGSMEPTVQIGDRIVVNKAAYGIRIPLTTTWVTTFDPPRRGDVVVLQADSPDILLKRVVAVGGDVVEVRDGRVLIDGAPVVDPATRAEGGGSDFGPARVPAGKVLVLGDNRGNSRDGRTFGWIDRSRIFGRASAVVIRHQRPTHRPL